MNTNTQTATLNSAAARDPMLKIENLSAAYGDVQVLWEVNMEVRQGEIVALVGSNGAGKTTLLSTISGLLKPKAGSITFMGQSIGGSDTRSIVEAGLVLVPEGRRLFGALSVRENLLMGAFSRTDKAVINDDLTRIMDMFPRLKQRVNSLGSKLSGGEQQMVAIGRGLMAKPSLLMIDELSLGLAPVIIEDLVEIIAQLNQQGLTILIVEQDVQTALEQANRGYVLETGHITLTDAAQKLLNDDRVRRAYLGI